MAWLSSFIRQISFYFTKDLPPSKGFLILYVILYFYYSSMININQIFHSSVKNHVLKILFMFLTLFYIRNISNLLIIKIYLLFISQIPINPYNIKYPAITFHIHSDIVVKTTFLFWKKRIFTT